MAGGCCVAPTGPAPEVFAGSKAGSITSTALLTSVADAWRPSALAFLHENRRQGFEPINGDHDILSQAGALAGGPFGSSLCWLQLRLRAHRPSRLKQR